MYFEEMPPLKQFREYNGIKAKDLAAYLGIGTAFMSQLENGGRPIPQLYLEKIRQNEKWETRMLDRLERVSYRPTKPRGNSGQYRLIPLYNLDARGGFETNEEVDVPEYVVDRIPFQNAHTGDICIPVSGDSMSPEIPSGSIVLLRELKRVDGQFYPEYGQVFVLQLTDGQRLLKVVRKKDRTCYELLSFNERYDPMEIPISMVEKMWRVISMYAKITM